MNAKTEYLSVLLILQKCSLDNIGLKLQSNLVNKLDWDQQIFFVIAVIRYNREDLHTNVTIWDHKLHF